MRLIDADAYQYPGDLENMPTVDPVFVVRCKDCEMAEESGGNYLICVGWGCPTDFDGFCHKGERRCENAAD